MRLSITKLLAICILLVAGNNVFAQLTGLKNIPGDYASLNLAIQDLNTQGVGSGGVTLNLLSGNPQTAPAGGFTITASGSAADPIVITGNGNIITASDIHTIGSVFDAVFKIVGGDYITIQNFSIQENAANTIATLASNTMTEFGIALFYATTTDGAQNNTIQNNVISLGNYQNAIGIFSTTGNSSTATAAAPATANSGLNSGLKVYGNTISNVAFGINIITPPNTASLTESGIDIGGTSVATGNTVTYGNNTTANGGWSLFSTTSSGISFRNGVGVNIRYNKVTSLSTLTVASIGIGLSAGTTPSGVTYINTISDNKVSMANVGTTAITGIDFGYGISTGTILGQNDTVIINQTASGASSAAVIGIRANYTSASNTMSGHLVTINQAQTTGALSGAVTGITLAGTSSSLNGTNNNVTINQSGSGTATISGAVIGITFNGASAQVNALSNNVSINQTTSVASGISNALTGIQASTAATGNTVNIGSLGNGNNVTIQQTVSGSGTYSTGAVTFIDLGTATHGTANVVDNVFGTGTGDLRSTGTMIGIQCNGTVSVLYNIRNNIANISRLSTSGNMFFTNQTGTPSNVADSVINNTVNFTNLATSGTVTGISQLGGPGSSGTKTIANNTVSINGTNTGTTKGIAWGYTVGTGGGRVTGNNVSISCAANIAIGIDGSGTSAKADSLTGNVLSITTTATAPTSVIGINCAGTGPYNVYNNNFSSIALNGVLTSASTSVVTGIALTVGTNNNIYNNTINNITVGASGSQGNPLVSGIWVSGGTSANVFKNKIYGVTTSASGTTTVVGGVRVSGGTTVNVFNNLIGDLTAPVAASPDALRGINITSTTTSSTVNVVYNTIYLNGSSTGANFGSSGIYHTASSTATTAKLVMANNIINNNSTPAGIGMTVAFRRSGTALDNYDPISNNNIFYAGSGSSNLIYYDGTNSYATLAAYKSAIGTADQSSFSENSSFLSTSGSAPSFLHIDATIPTLAESGATYTALITDDYDGDIRNSSTPDIGADEFTGITPAPQISNVTRIPAGIQCLATARTITANVVTLGAPVTSVTINYNNGSVGSAPMSLISGTNTNGVWSGVIPAAVPANSNVTWSITASDGTFSSTETGNAYKDAYLLNAATIITATPSSICAGNNASLSVTTIDGGPGFATIGTQTTTLGGADGNPYRTGNGAGNQIRVQLLYTASELTAMGMTAGPINSIGLTTTTSSGTVANFSIAMKHTAQATTTTSFDNTGFTTVFSQASFTPVAGLNTHTFSTPFVWDGISNLLVNFCQTNNVSGTSTVAAYIPTTPSNLNSAGTTTGCSAATGNIVSAKPILTFGGILGTSYTSTMNYTWTPTSQTGSSISVSPASTTTYTVSGIDGNGCTVMSSPATVTVNTLPTTPSAINSTQCGVGIPTASVASTAGSNGSGTFLWYDAPNGGTLLQGAALGNTLNTYYVNDFSSSVLTNSSISGAAAIGSGTLTLHPATTSQQGGLTVNASGVNSTIFQTTFDLSLTATGTTLADGFSYSFADDALATTTSPTAEHGSGSKLRIGFFTFNAANGSDGKGIYLMYNVSATTGYTSSTPGVVAYSSDVSWIPTSATTQTSPVSISINTSGQLTLIVGATTIFNNVQLPAAFVNANKSSWKHVFASRSGGTAGGFAMDNLEIKANDIVPGYTTYQNSITATDTFYVSEMGVNGCESQRVQVIATVTQPDVVTASSGTTLVCMNSPLTLNVAQSGTNNNYAYSWTAAPSAGSGISGSPLAGQNISVTPTSAGTYTYTVAAYDAALGCNTSSNVVVTVNSQPAAPVVTPASAQLCPGGIQPLSINSTMQYNFGTQAAQNGTANNATDFPAPYTVWWGGQRMQMLITAAELTTAGFSAGSSINNIQFPVVSLGTNWGTTLTALQGFQVSIGSTSLSTLSAFQTGLTQVVAPAGFTPTVGYANTHNFSTPFVWDGISNLILETTFSNNVGGTANDVVVQYNSPTSYQSTIVYRADNVTAAAAASATTVSHSYSARPDFKLNGSNIIPTWTPLTGLYTDASATIPYTGGQEDTVYAKPANTTTYVATVANAIGCSNTTPVTVSVGAPTVTATASVNSICANTGFDLSANILSEDFNNGTNNWTLINNSTGGTPANSNWQLRNSPYTYGTEILSSNDASQFYISNSDAQGSGGNTLTILQSPAFSTNGMTSLNLDFYHYFRAVSGDSANVEVSTDGTNWTLVQAFTATQGAPSAFATGSVNLNSYIGNSSVYVRFRYKAAFGWYWAIDNVKLSGSSTNTFAWTSSPSGFSAGVQNPTAVTGTDTTLYTVTVTDANNCTATSSVTVNIQPTITGNTIGTPQTLCSGSAPAQLTGTIPTGGSGIYAYQWQGSITSATSGFINVTSGGNATDYTPTAPTMTTWYRRVVTSGNCSDTSAAIEITVTPGITNNTISANQNICSGATPAQLLGSTPTGAGGSYTYTWLSSNTNATTGFANAAGINTNIDYTPSSLTANTWFRRVVNTTTCTDTSAAVAITVSLPVTGSTISAPQTICSGNAPQPLTGNFAGINEDMNGLTSTAGLTTANLPTGWMMTLNQGNLLTGFNTNSYGRAGTNGAIRSNNFSVGNGNVAQMDTKTFGPSLSGDTLRFDVAYAGYDDAFGPYIDTLRVYANTGSGFTLLKQYVTGLVIDTSENGITTANWISTGFAPTASQWARKAIALPTGTSNVRFEFASGFGNRMYVDRIQTDSATFTWLSSTTSASAGFGVASGVSNASGYAPGTLTQTTWFKRVANKGTSCSADTSAAMEITVNNGVVVVTPPSATVNVCESNAILLSVNATNATGYQWYKGVNPVVNTTNISGATSATLRIDNAVASDAGTYSVVMNAATGCNNVTSSTSTVSVNSLGSSLATNGSSNTYVHSDGVTNLYADASCNPILKIEDVSGGNNLGSVQADVAVSGSVQTAPGGQKYLQRSYTVTPASNGAAIVTLYALQSEFTAYNAAPGSYPSMPVSGNNSDPNIGNIRVTKYTGSPFVGGGNALLITPTSVSWNSTANWWEITFPVSSFSSFYIHTGTIGPLSIDLRSIRAVNVGTRNRIDWMTANEKDADKFEVESSADGINYRKIGSVKAKGEASSYSLWDELPYHGLNHYRLKMFNLKGEFIYSTTVTAFVQSNDVFVVDAYPNPAKDELTVRINGKIGANATIILTDMAGKLIVEQKVSDVNTVIDLTKVAQGVYFMKYTDDKHSETIKVNKR